MRTKRLPNGRHTSIPCVGARHQKRTSAFLMLYAQRGPAVKCAVSQSALRDDGGGVAAELRAGLLRGR